MYLELRRKEHILLVSITVGLYFQIMKSRTKNHFYSVLAQILHKLALNSLMWQNETNIRVFKSKLLLDNERKNNFKYLITHMCVFIWSGLLHSLICRSRSTWGNAINPYAIIFLSARYCICISDLAEKFVNGPFGYTSEEAHKRK